MMYQNALNSLYNGAVMPHEREILARAPLPTDIVDPFVSQDVDPLQIMGFAYNSLITWIDEAKKANYFSKKFTDLSKLVMKGVMTMGRGLVALHNRGEDLAQAPMQIGDLISVSSYHFRKSYLGVIQTASSNPEISERLLINQLSWTNMLFRLYKTKDKLEKAVSSQGSVVRLNAEALGNSRPNCAGDQGNPKLSDPFSDDDQGKPMISAVSGRPLPDITAIFEPGAFSAPRALSALDGSRECGSKSKNAIRNSKSISSEKSGKEETNEVCGDPQAGQLCTSRQYHHPCRGITTGDQSPQYHHSRKGITSGNQFSRYRCSHRGITTGDQFFRKHHSCRGSTSGEQLSR